MPRFLFERCGLQLQTKNRSTDMYNNNKLSPTGGSGAGKIARVEPTLDDFEVLQEIGNGSFGKVYKIMRKRDQKIMVWKVIHFGSMSSKERESLVTEVNIIKDLNHPFIIRYYDRVIDRNRKNIHIVMEYCASGDLSQYIKSMRRESRYFDEETIWRLFSQLCMAIKACHCRTSIADPSGVVDSTASSKCPSPSSPNEQQQYSSSPSSSSTKTGGRIIHRDLKPGNIMLDEEYNVKLGDFGLAKILSNSKVYAHTNVGTPYYMSPEQVTDSGYDEKGDIWSLGCILYEMCALSPPFEASNHLALAMKIKEGVYKPLDRNRYSQTLRDLIDNMLSVDPTNRMSIEQICGLPPVRERILELTYRERFRVLKRREEEVKREMEKLRRDREELKWREYQLAERIKQFASMGHAPVSNK